MGRRPGGLPSIVRIVVIGAIWALSLAEARPAAADCNGPTVEYGPLDVEPGDTVTVRGTAFGTNCYDTGPPPAGQGVLGKPVSDIEVLVVQDGEERLVASGSADDEYQFEVDVTVPADLAPGEAALIVRRPDGGFVLDATAQPIQVAAPAPNPAGAGVSAGGEAAVGVATFGPGAPVDPAQVPTPTRERTDDRPGTGLLLVGAVLLVVVAVGFTVAVAAFTRRDRE